MTSRILISLALASLLAGCGGDAEAPPAPDASDGYELRTDEDLPEALAIFDARARDDLPADVVVVGRVRQIADGVVTLIDDELDYCGRGDDEMENCPTPWDYCCTSPNVVTEGSLTVEMKDARGQDVPVDVLNLRLLDLVAVEGKLSKDPDGSPVLTAKGRWFRRERPALGAHVTWPN